jgi:hypothetical protein
MAVAVGVHPTQGCRGTLVTVTGTGFNPGDTITLTIEYRTNFTVPFSGSPVVAGDGTVNIAFVIPDVSAGLADGIGVRLDDQSGNNADAFLTVCCPIHSDSLDTADGVFIGPNFPTGEGLRDYAFCQGKHWVVWENLPQPDWIGNAFPILNPTFTVVSVDDATGATTTYTVDTDICWGFASSEDAYLGDNNRRNRFWIPNASKPVHDVKLASDGDTLWLAVLTEKTVVYPYISGDDTHSGQPSQVAQFATIASFTSGFTYFPRSHADAVAHDPTFIRLTHNSSGVFNIYAPNFPNSDAGEHWSGYWTIPNVVVFAFSGGGFAKIGEEQAAYYPGSVSAAGNDTAIVNFPLRFNGVDGVGSRLSSILTGLAVCASPAQPGVMHLVWGEGGIYGRYGAGPVGGTAPTVWDGGPSGQAYRMNYQQWSAGGQTSSDDFSVATYDRTSAFFLFEASPPSTSVFKCGSWWPPVMPVTSLVGLRNDSGSPLMFIADFLVMPGPPPNGQTNPDPGGHPWLGYTADYAEPTIRLLELPGLAQIAAIPGGLLPPAAVVQRGWPGVGGSNRFYVIVTFDGSGANATWGFPVVGRRFGISQLYDDPEVGPAYIVGVPFQTVIYNADRSLQSASGLTDGFYRVPAAGGSFDYIDGIDPAGPHLNRYIFCVGGTTNDVRPFLESSPDLINDPRNVWCTAGGTFATVAQLERICLREWTPAQKNSGTNPLSSFLGSSHYDAVNDRVAYGGITQVARVKICRFCVDCSCGLGQGVHVSKRLLWGGGPA